MIFFLFLFFPHTKVRGKKKIRCFYSIPFIFISHCLEVGEGGQALPLRGVATKHEFLTSPACADPVSCPWSQMISLVRRQLVWQSRGRSGLGGRGGLPWPGSRAVLEATCGWLVAAGAPVKARGTAQPPLAASSPRCSQACSQPCPQHPARSQNPFFIGLKRALWWAGPRLPSLFDPPLLSRPFASGRWHSLIPQVPWGALSPEKGHSQVTAPPLGFVLGAEQLVRACPALTMCLPGDIFVFHPTTALREAFGECLSLQKAQ